MTTPALRTTARRTAEPETPWQKVGLVVGHATDHEGATGCTVIRAAAGGMRASAALIGRASGTRELAVCRPEHLVDRIDAVLLSGGSAYGLDAAAGVMQWMEEKGRGFVVGAGVVPIVPAAVLFDLAPLGSFRARPTPAMAYQACDTATAMPLEGSVGAGTGAMVGRGLGVEHAMKGGVGCGSASSGAFTAVALAVVNSYGDVRDADGRIIAGARSDHDEFADTAAIVRASSEGPPQRFAQATIAPPDGMMRNTTLAVVAVNASVSRVALQQMAQAATAAFYRRITPCGTTFDGDVVFALCPPVGAVASAVVLEALAVAALEEAIERAVRTAVGRDGVPGLADPVAG
ncbi:MAG: P1 family peptidase [Gemmatimonadaceae bacterium]|jgi:L-aminopeptidase/D-esterase-like protein|nr:P1 family peptidase [Gemmatimonadaceae bacterium]